MAKKTAVQIGAGKIGRGFIGAVLEKSGYHVVFSDIDRALVDLINSEKKYTVHIADKKPHEFVVDDIEAVDASMPESVEQMAKADLITTAVGVDNLSKVAFAIAKALVLREKNKVRKTLDIIACENVIDATSELQSQLMRRLDPITAAYVHKKVGFANCSVDRIVPPVRCENPVDISVEEFFEWEVDKNAIKANFEDIKGVDLVERPDAYVQRKFFTLNTGHAIAAYLGKMKGCETIAEALDNRSILKIVKGAMDECGEILIKKFGFKPEIHEKYIEQVIERFQNPYLKDDVTRVGHSPMRKLSKNDRLVAPLLLAKEYGISTPNMLLGIGAALHYEDNNDPQSIKIVEGVKKEGVAETFAKVAEVSDKEILKKVESAYKSIAKKMK